MDKFIKINNHVINRNEVASAKFVDEDIYEGLFPKDEQGRYKVDYIEFKFAEVKLKSGKVIDVTLSLYAPEEDEDYDEWFQVNLATLREAWDEILEELNPVEITTAREI